MAVGVGSEEGRVSDTHGRRCFVLRLDSPWRRVSADEAERVVGVRWCFGCGDRRRGCAMTSVFHELGAMLPVLSRRACEWA
jgi:hypothetical protein